MSERFTKVKVGLRNTDNVKVFGISILRRNTILNLVGNNFGLDIYFSGELKQK